MKKEIPEHIKQSCFDLKEKSTLWKDITTHSRDDKERVPTIFQMEVSGFSACIVFNHMHYPGEWVISCQHLYGSGHKRLGAITAKEAASATVLLCKHTLNKIVQAFNEL